MPVVPSSGGPTVGQAPTPTIHGPAEAFGAGNAARPVDLSPVANVATGIYRQAKQRADQIAVVDAGSKLSALETSLLYDPKTGALAQRGKNAFGAMDTVSEAWRTQTADLESTLSNDDQKAQFRRMVDSHGASLNEQVQRHVANEQDAYDKESTAAYLSNEQSAGINGTPERTEMAIANQRATVMDFGKRNGWSDDQVQEHIAQNVSKTRFGVLERLVNGEQDIAATKYLNEHRADFVGSDLLQAEKLTDAGSTRAESQRQGDDITAKATSLGDALSSVRNITDPRVRDATEQRVRRFYADQAADLREQRAQSFDTVSQLIEQNGGDVHSLPIKDMLNLTPEQHTAIEHRADEIRHPKVVTNTATYTHLINLAGLSDSTRAEFMKINFMDPKYKDQLSDTDFRQIVNLQRSMRVGEDKADDAAARRDDASEKRDAAHTAAATRSLHRREEADVLKGTATANKAAATAATAEKIAPGSSKYMPPAPSVTVPKWMTDSAATDGEYHDYLKGHGVKGLPPKPGSSTADTPRNLPPSPKVPGGPIGNFDLGKITNPKGTP